MARCAAGGSSYCACGNIELVYQFRHFHPLVIAKLEASFERRKIRLAQLQRRAEQFAIGSGGLDTVYGRVHGGDFVHLARQRIAPGGVGPGAQRIVPVVVRGLKQARDLGLVEYWRARGWPAQCRPLSGNDFTCS